MTKIQLIHIDEERTRVNAILTINELAEICKVSVSTVSKALNGYPDISEKTRNYVINTANEVGYFPNANARSLKLKKSYSIGVLFSTYTNIGLRNDYFAHILTAFKDEAAQKGYDITFVENYIGRRKLTYLEHCQYRDFDGVCIVCSDYENEEVINLVNSDIPTVTIDYEFQKAFSIISDNYNGMKQLTEYIIKQGHTDIALIHGVKTTVTTNRIDGFLDAMQENGLTVPKEYIMESGYRNATLTEEVTKMLLQLPHRPSCIIAPDDQAAVGTINAIMNEGLHIIEDISVAGYDGFDISHLTGIKLTTVKQERDQIGKEAARKLIHLIEEKTELPSNTEYMKQTLIIGNSVRKIN